MVGIIPAQVWDTFVVAQSLGYLLFTFSPTQHRGPNKSDGRIYPGPFWPCTSQPNDVTNGIYDYGTEVQRSSAQSQPKRKELIFDEVQTGKTQKGRSWYLAKYRREKSQNGKSWSLTKVQTKKSQNGKSWSLTKVLTDKSQNGKSLFDKSTNKQISKWKEFIFNKGTGEQSQSIRKEPMRTSSVGKGKNWSSNTNGPQIIITGPLRNYYKLRPSEHVKICFSHWTNYTSYQITFWLERRSACRYPAPRV